MTGARAFLRLDDVVLAPPLPAVLSILMATGLGYLGWRLAYRLRRGRPEALDGAAGFMFAAAVTAVIVHAVALAQLSSIAVLRPAGWGLAALGAVALVRHHRALWGAARREVASLRSAPLGERVVVLVAGAIVLGLSAATLGPPTDPDSLAYHLNVPLDWLRHGGAYARPDWFTARLVGIGESLNLLGLAAGTDSLGAALQLGGLVSAAVAVSALAPTARDRRLGWLLAVGCPIAGFLVPNQKPQMLPIAATTVALVLAVRRFDDFRVADALLAFSAAAFALASKFSFILTAGFAVAVGLYAAWRCGRLAAALGVAAAAIAVVWVPVLARNFAFYGDPLSPFLERLKPHPDPAVAIFAQYLRDFGGTRDAPTLLRLTVSLLGTTNVGALTTPLGLGALAFIPALRVKGSARLLLLAALAATVTSVVLGQLGGRFLFEPFLWAGAAYAVADWSRAKKLVAGGLVLQGTLSAAVALFGAGLLFPGALTAHARDTVLTRSAPGYPESKWLDALLPKGAIMVQPQSRPSLFTPRPFAIADSAMGDTLPADVGDQHLRALIEEFGINTVVDDGAPRAGPYARLEQRCGHPLGPPSTFPLATRNPTFHMTYTAQVYVIRDCYPAHASEDARPW